MKSSEHCSGEVVKESGSVPETTRFEFFEILERWGIRVPDTVFVNWDRFETVESMVTAQLAEFFDYI